MRQNKKKQSFLKKPVASSSSSEDDHQIEQSQLPVHIQSESEESYRRASIVKEITETIEDGIDQFDFDIGIDEKVQQIQQEMIVYGDAQQDVNDLRNVEFRIQSARILALLDRCIDHVNLMFHLPSILQSQEQCHIDALQELSDADLKVLKDTYDVFHVSSDAMTRSDSSTLSVYLEQAIRVAVKYDLKKWFPIEFNSVPFAAGRFTNQLRALRDLAEHRINWTAPKTMAKEKRLHAMWTENFETSVKVKELQAQVSVEQVTLKHKIEAGEMQLHTRQEKIRQLNEENMEKITRTIYESNLKMNKASKDSEAKQIELQQRVKDARAFYDNMLQTNLATGKKMRENKLKAEQKLQSWLTKYDTDVGERNRELFVIKDQLEEETDQLESFMRKYDEQEEEYKKIQQLIQDEYIRERDEKVRIFTMEYAAKKIQRAVRLMIKKKKQKKKGKKGKK